MGFYDENQGSLDESAVSKVQLKEPLLSSQNEPLQQVARSRPLFRVTINDNDVSGSLMPFITGIQVIDNDDLAPRFRIELNNDRFLLTNNPQLVEGSVVRIWTGYKTTQLLYRGTFIMDKPIHDDMNGKSPRVVLTGMGEISRMAKIKIQKVWNNKTDTQIATEIAAKYGFDIDADETNIKNEYVHQMSETDIQFLQRRARLYGYQIYLDTGQLVDNEGISKRKPILHFHKVRHIDSGLTFRHEAGQRTNIYGIKLEVPTHRRNMVFKKEFFNPTTGKLTLVQSEDTLDDRTRKVFEIFAKAAKLFGFKLPEQIGETVVDQPTERQIEYIIGEGSAATTEETVGQVQAFAEANTYNVRGKFSTFGNERLSAGSSIRVTGLQKFSGTYYVKRVIHHMGFVDGKNAGYRCEVEIRTNVYQNQVSATPVLKINTSSINVNNARRNSPDDISKELKVVGSFEEQSNGSVEQRS